MNNHSTNVSIKTSAGIETNNFKNDSVDFWNLENKPKKDGHCSISCFKADAKIKVSSKHFEKPPILTERNYKPGVIERFSKKAQKNLKFKMKNAEFDYYGFVTLTYPQNFINDGEEVKEHLNAFLQFLRRRKVKYIWVLEFQKNGSPHYHIAIDEYINHKLIAYRWYKIVNSGNPDHLKAGTQIKKINSDKHAQRYMSKYLKKKDSKTVPLGYTQVGRFWGASKNIAPKKVEINISGELTEI